MLKHLHRDLYTIVIQYLQQYELIQLILLNHDFYQLIMKYIKQTRFIKIKSDKELNTHINKIISIIQMKTKLDWNWGLINACQRGHMKIVKFMIEKGANHWNEGLFYACGGGHMEIVKLMIKKGANNWSRRLWSACRKGHITIKYVEPCRAMAIIVDNQLKFSLNKLLIID